jgi:predicted DNA-binding transcriptional regulator YafY
MPYYTFWRENAAKTSLYIIQSLDVAGKIELRQSYSACDTFYLRQWNQGVAMNSRRLARLMEIICIIKAHPRRDPDEMCTRLNISRRQFYKDRDTLINLGFNFHYSRKLGGFVLDKELVFNAGPMSIADFFALIESVTRLNGPDDFPLALAALNGLKNIAALLPEGMKPLFENAIRLFIFEEQFKCDPEVLDALLKAVAQKQRIIVVQQENDSSRQTEMTPLKLHFNNDQLQVMGGTSPEGETSSLRLDTVKRVIALEPVEQELPFPA